MLTGELLSKHIVVEVQFVVDIVVCLLLIELGESSKPTVAVRRVELLLWVERATGGPFEITDSVRYYRVSSLVLSHLTLPVLV